MTNMNFLKRFLVTALLLGTFSGVAIAGKNALHQAFYDNRNFAGAYLTVIQLRNALQEPAYWDAKQAFLTKLKKNLSEQDDAGNTPLHLAFARLRAIIQNEEHAQKYLVLLKKLVGNADSEAFVANKKGESPASLFFTVEIPDKENLRDLCGDLATQVMEKTPSDVLTKRPQEGADSFFHEALKASTREGASHFQHLMVLYMLQKLPKAELEKADTQGFTPIHRVLEVERWYFQNQLLPLKELQKKGVAFNKAVEREQELPGYTPLQRFVVLRVAGNYALRQPEDSQVGAREFFRNVKTLLLKKEHPEAIYGSPKNFLISIHVLAYHPKKHLNETLRRFHP